MADDRALLTELEPTVATLLDRHLATTKEWFPHEFVPWSRGRDHEPGHEWSPADGAVVALDFGCGAHSEVDVEERPSEKIDPPVLDDESEIVFTER